MLPQTDADAAPGEAGEILPREPQDGIGSVASERLAGPGRAGRQGRLPPRQRQRRQVIQQGAANAFEPDELVTALPAHGKMGPGDRSQGARQSSRGKAQQGFGAEMMGYRHLRSSTSARSL